MVVSRRQTAPALVQPRPAPRAVATGVLALLACMLPGPFATARAQDTVRRCTTAAGTPVYTDKRCEDVGATATPLRPAGTSATGLRQYRMACARTVQDLVFEVTAAIDAQDVNRLAGVYHWRGMSSSAAVPLMGRLEAVVRRPLVDVIPVPARPPDPELDYQYPSTIPARHAPVALRVEQTLGNTATPSRTVFGLRRHLDCWWISL